MVADAQTKATEQAQARAAQEQAEKDAVRVTHVPEIVREQIRNELREEVKDDIAKSVVATAKQEGWGVPGALPEWAKNVKLYGDVRARHQWDWYADDNVFDTGSSYLDFNRANADRRELDAALNTTKDRERFVGRVRLGLAAQLGNDFGLDVRLASGNATSPVSTNQALGNYGGRWSLAVDRASLNWRPTNETRTQEFDFRMGRFANPFVGVNELMWDYDLSFEGAVAGYAWDAYNVDGQALERGVFLTVGAFPLQEVELSADDKWLYGAQLGTEVPLGDSRLRLAGGYFYYRNITGVRNAPTSNLTDFTAPRFLQKGNTVFNIDQDQDEVLYALVGEYRIANASIWLDFDMGANHLAIGGEYVKNLAWDSDEVRARTNDSVSLILPGSLDPFNERVNGYEFGVTIGRPALTEWGHWRASAFYKYVERDAVLDAFTDSDFHLGGTDAKGYQFSFDLGLARGAWLKLRYLSANEIDGQPLGIDVLQLDLNGQF
jgi:hypothetical protein